MDETSLFTAVRDDALDADTPPGGALALLRDRWREARGEAPWPVGPAEAFADSGIVGLKGRVCIIDVDASANEYRFRLLGERSGRILPGVAPGSAVSAIPHAAYRLMLQRHYAAAVHGGQPSLHRIELDGPTRRSRYTRLLLPVSEDGRGVTALVSAGLCDKAERKTDARARAVLADLQRLIPAEIPRLQRYALYLTRHRSDAEDLVQDTVERALAQLHMLAPGYAIQPWLCAIMHNLHARQARRTPRHTAEPAVTADSPLAVAATTVEQNLIRSDIDRSLRTLPPQQKQVVELVVLGGLSYQGAAEKLAIPIGTVMSRLARGREKLRELLAA